MGYAGLEVVRGVTLAVNRGEIFALLGPNGAGKTTTVEILEGYRRRTAGEVEVLGEDPAQAGPAWRGRVGVVLQSCQPEHELTVAETVALYAGFYDAPLPVAEVLALVGLTAEAKIRNSRLSGGQQRRLDVGLALVGDPELVFLDEPTTGFDPAARRAAWEVIAGLRARGKTIFLTTHYLEEAEFLADRIAVMVAGQIVAEGTSASLGDRHRSRTEIRIGLQAPPVLADLPPLSGQPAWEAGELVLAAADPLRDLNLLTGWLLTQGLGVEAISVRQPSLEEVYLRLTAPAETVS